MSNDQTIANGLPHGSTLNGFLQEVGAVGLEVRACRVEAADEGACDEHIASDADASNIVFFGIYARNGHGELSVLHDMAALKPDADIMAAQGRAVGHAFALIAASGLPLPQSIPAPF